MTDRYQLLIRKDSPESESSSCEDLSSRLVRVPTIERVDLRHYVFGGDFGEADEAGRVHLSLPECDVEDEFSRIEVDIPRSWVPEKGPQIFALVFMAASWLSWEVYDPQIDDTLKKDVVLQGLVAMRRAQLEGEGEK